MTPITEYSSHAAVGAATASRPARWHSVLNFSCFALLLLVLWSLMHRYQGFSRDGELYAVQAFARLHPGLSGDLYLQYASQDRFTLFSPFYAAFMRVFGLLDAAIILIVAFTAGFLIAAWHIARDLADRQVAWLAAALLIIIPGHYGSFDVFHFLEPYLTARSMAEALVAIALACHFRGASNLALAIAVAALFIHPLMALPGLLLLACLRLPLKTGLLAAASGLAAALIVAVAAPLSPSLARLFPLIDGAWLEVVRQRAQFLFLQLWEIKDWELNARPFLCLTLTLLALPDARIRSLCRAALLVGATGLAVAFIAGAIGPVALLLQGQAWRWVWVTSFVSVLLLAPTFLAVWRDENCGPVCALLLLAGWVFAPIDGMAFIALALILWLIRGRITARAARLLRWAAVGLAAVMVAWLAANVWNLVAFSGGESGREPLAVTRLRNIFGLEIPAVLLFAVLWYWLAFRPRVWFAGVLSALLIAAAAYVLPGAFRQFGTVGSAAEVAEFADWREAIPPTSSVLIASAPVSAAFSWFTLERPNYLSVDQSSGVVFSRATALEVRRRSELLLPLMDPGWKVLDSLKRGDKGKKIAVHPLTRESLVGVCRDPALGFVISKEAVGFEPLRHTAAGLYRDWNLYDCRRVRAMAAA